MNVTIAIVMVRYSKNQIQSSVFSRCVNVFCIQINSVKTLEMYINKAVEKGDLDTVKKLAQLQLRSLESVSPTEKCTSSLTTKILN